MANMEKRIISESSYVLKALEGKRRTTISPRIIVCMIYTMMNAINTPCKSVVENHLCLVLRKRYINTQDCRSEAVQISDEPIECSFSEQRPLFSQVRMTGLSR